MKLKLKRWLAVLAALLVTISLPFMAFSAGDTGGQPGDDAPPPAEGPAEPPGEAPDEAPADDPDEAPGDDPAEAPGEDPSEAPADDPGEAPADDPDEAPADDPEEAPADDPTEAPSDAPATVEASGPWFTEDQARRGAAQYRVHCSSCHGAELEGVFAPGLSGGEFFDVWTTAGHLYDYYSVAMPPTNPGGLSDQVYTDILAHILHFNGYPAGDEELPVDSELFYQIPVERME